MKKLHPPSNFAVDNTARRLMNTCERKYLLSTILGYKTEFGSNAIRYGSTFHGFKEGYYSYIKDHGWSRDGGAIDQAIKYGRKVWEEDTVDQKFNEDDYRTFEVCAESFLECITEYNSDYNHLEVIDTETVFEYTVDVPTQYFEKYPALRGVTFRHTGKIDLRAKLSNLPWIFEFKTTGQSIDIQVSRLNRNPQIMGYQLAAKRLNYGVEGSIILFHQITSRRKKDGDWGSLTRAFRRTPMIFTEQDLEAWFDSYLSTVERIVRCYEVQNWPMQHDRCYEFGRCTYCSLCEQNLPLVRIIEEVPQGFVQKYWDVREEGGAD